MTCPTGRCFIPRAIRVRAGAKRRILAAGPPSRGSGTRVLAMRSSWLPALARGAPRVLCTERASLSAATAVPEPARAIEREHAAAWYRANYDQCAATCAANGSTCACWGFCINELDTCKAGACESSCTRSTSSCG